MSTKSALVFMDILVIEPFHGGSHAQLIQVLLEDQCIGPKLKIHTLPAKKWHWRARASAPYFMQTIPQSQNYGVLLSSSVLNLAELIALRLDLAKLKKVVYFHENQLVYPVQKHRDRDFHYGYSQITTSLVADTIVFNSHFNMESFLTSVSHYLKLMPDFRPKNLEAEIRPKCRVIYFPVDFQTNSNPVIITTKTQKTNEKDETDLESETDAAPSTATTYNSCGETNKQAELTEHNENCAKLGQQSDEHINATGPETKSRTPLGRDSILHIVWPHRWEHDKNPESFFKALFRLLDEGYDFKVSVLGESYQEVPEIFNIARSRLNSRVIAWGFQDRKTYRDILDSAHVVVSTANHEFFGVSMLEATSRGCFPLCPKRLVYPEIYPDECLYSTQTQLEKRLKQFCRRPDKIQPPKINLERFTWKCLQKDYYDILNCDP